MKWSICCLILALIATPALGAVPPRTMSYQGVLTDNLGNIVPNGAHHLVFTIYDDPLAGTPGFVGPNTLWTEDWPAVPVTLGGFSVLLGSTNPLSLKFDKQYYLGICVDPPGVPPYPPPAEIAPRIVLAGSPYLLAGPVFAHTGTSATTTIGATWTNYVGGIVTIDAPGPGYVVVDADFWLQIHHTVGIRDEVMVGIATTATAAPNFEGLYTGDVASEAATFPTRDLSGHVRYVFSVGPGLATYFLNAEMSSGQDASDVFWYANMNAIYYYDPAPTIAPPAPGLAKARPVQELTGAVAQPK
jgi:hypothetical protein